MHLCGCCLLPEVIGPGRYPVQIPGLSGPLQPGVPLLRIRVWAHSVPLSRGQLSIHFVSTTTTQSRIQNTEYSSTPNTNPILQLLRETIPTRRHLASQHRSRTASGHEHHRDHGPGPGPGHDHRLLITRRARCFNIPYLRVRCFMRRGRAQVRPSELRCYPAVPYELGSPRSRGFLFSLRPESRIPRTNSLLTTRNDIQPDPHP